MQDAFETMSDDLPELDKAIEMAKSIDDGHVTQAEYLSTKGEILHALSHLDSQYHDDWAQQSIRAFREALALIKQVPTAQATPRHVLLAEKLGDVKIPHMCGRHGGERNNTTQSMCQAASVDAHGFREHVARYGVLRPTPTPIEQSVMDESKRQTAAPIDMNDIAAVLLFLLGGRR